MKVEAKWNSMDRGTGEVTLTTVQGEIALGGVVRSVRHGYYAYMGTNGWRIRLGRCATLSGAKRKVERGLGA